MQYIRQLALGLMLYLLHTLHKTVLYNACTGNGDACAVPDNEVIATATAISMETPQQSDGATTESSITQSTVMSTSGILGALIGLLAAALVVVVTGWIVSCVYLQRKINIVK